MTVLQINSLRTCFNTSTGIVKAVDGVSLEVNNGEVLGIVGESGCGKSVLALSILRLLPEPPAFFAGGEILFKGLNLIEVSQEEIRKIRGNSISMIFQEPMTAL
ncbi:MAG: ABC transporter ATP-binding protein, partial [Deltaproteobacteria bacterium]